MADVNSSLPVRTENNADVVVSVADSAVPSRTMTVEADGSINVNALVSDGTDTLEINADGSINSVVTQSAHDNLNANANLQVGNADVSIGNPVPTSTTNGATEATLQSANSHLANIESDVDSINVKFDATISTRASEATLSDLNGKFNNGYGSAAGGVRVASQIGNSGGEASFGAGATSAQTLRTVSNLMDESGNAFSVANPLPGQISDGTDTLAVNTDGSINVKILDGSPGTDVADYDSEAAVAGGASDTHTYTPGSDFSLTQIEASSSNRMRIEIKVAGVTKFVMFNTEAVPNISLHLKNPIVCPTGQTVEVIRTNRGMSATDVFSTIIGYLG